MKKISVIIPAFNAEKTIEKCINSIINQTYKNLEIIIVNDGSSDKTSEICRKFNDNRIIVFDNKNKGVSFSRNYGIKKSTGDFITFVDSDDYLELDCYENVVKIFEKNPEIDFVRFNYSDYGINESKPKEIYNLKDSIVDFKQDCRNAYLHFFTNKENIPCFVMLLMIKKELGKKLKFNEKLSMMEDVNFYLDLFFKQKKAFFSSKKLYNYYINPNSVTNSIKNYEKNIFGILDTNICINKKVGEKFNKDLISDMNCSHLNIIANILIKLYELDKHKYKTIILKLRQDNRFISLCKYNKSLKLKNKLYIYCIKNKLFLTCKIYLNMINLLKKI